jgi:carbon monoxide dehydrogenase subunit G
VELSGQTRIEAPRQLVWESLNDPALLRAVIPGCEDAYIDDDGSMHLSVLAGVGPVGVRFGGIVRVVDPDPPDRYRLEGEASGGFSGNLTGAADITLTEDGKGTVLGYRLTAEIGGMLETLGGAALQKGGESIAAGFFLRFKEAVERDLATTPYEHHEADAIEEATVSIAHGEPADTFAAVEEVVEREVVRAATRSGPYWPLYIGLVALVVLAVFLAVLQFS